MTNTSSKAGNSRQKPSFIRRLTRSFRKTPHVKLADKKGKAIMVEAEPKKQVAKPEDDKWIQTAYIDLTSSESDSSVESDPSEEIPTQKGEEPMENDPSEEKTAEEKKSPENEHTSKYTPIEYPIFPPDYFNLEVEDDGSEQFIELKGSDTIYPGSPGYLPERIPIQKWFHEVMWGGDEGKPYQKMVRYSRITSSRRIPIAEAKKQGIKLKTKLCWIDAINWYSNAEDETP